MKKLPISVFIIAKDEQERIAYSIKSVVQWVDEVIVIDSGSKDDTVALSEKLEARVVFNEWQGYGPQKVYGESICRNDWLLNIDADEEISENLAAEIIALFAEGRKLPLLEAYRIKIKLMDRFSRKPSWLAPSNNPIRLYNKKYAGFKSSTVHDSVVLFDDSKGIGQLKHIVNHRSFKSFEHAVQKVNFYSSMQAEDMFKKGRKPMVLRVVTEPFVAFLKAYFLRRYFLLKLDGFVYSLLYSFAKTLRLAKARERFRAHDAGEASVKTQ